MERGFSNGVVFILEGDTEKEFYLALLTYFCKKHTDWQLRQESDFNSGDVFYVLTNQQTSIIVKMFVVGSISQVVNSCPWFESRCHKAYPSIKWVVFLCYDTDNYLSSVTKFHEGDWKALRNQLSKCKAVEIVDLAAQADIEDIMLLDSDGIFRFLELQPCTIPSGSKGKIKMKKLFRLRGPGSAYHEGRRARDLINALDFGEIVTNSLLDFQRIEQVCFSDDK